VSLQGHPLGQAPKAPAFAAQHKRLWRLALGHSPRHAFFKIEFLSLKIFKRK
jgi:hypothetical protein